jgi:hypothetical protein
MASTNSVTVCLLPARKSCTGLQPCSHATMQLLSHRQTHCGIKCQPACSVCITVPRHLGMPQTCPCVTYTPDRACAAACQLNVGNYMFVCCTTETHALLHISGPERPTQHTQPSPDVCCLCCASPQH